MGQLKFHNAVLYMAANLMQQWIKMIMQNIDDRFLLIAG